MGDSLVYGREEKREDFEGEMEDFGGNVYPFVYPCQ